MSSRLAQKDDHYNTELDREIASEKILKNFNGVDNSIFKKTKNDSVAFPPKLPLTLSHPLVPSFDRSDPLFQLLN